MAKLPPPLVPPECNTAGNDWMPLYGDRLMRSKWWRRASDTARARNVMLWWRAFRESPAGSLPDDDDDLAEAAGYGFDIDSWAAVKPEIMSAWTLCSDGRWYHPTVCEVVLDTWERTSERRKKSAEKKAAQRAVVRGVAPMSRGTDGSVPRDTRENEGDIDTQTDRHDRQTDLEANASLSPAGDESDDLTKYPAAFEAIWKAYPHFKGRSSKRDTYALWRRLSPTRRKALPSAIARYASDGHEPNAPCGSPAMEKWLERELDLNWHDAADVAAAVTFAGPAELRAQIVAAKGESWTRAWVDQCGWQDVPTRALLAPLAFTADTITKAVDAILAEAGVGVLVQPKSRTAA